LLRHQPVAGLEPDSFDAAFIELVDDDIAHVAEILDIIAQLLRPGGQIVLVAVNSDWFAGAGNLGRIFATTASSLVYSRLWPDEVRVGSVSRFRWWVNGACVAVVGGLFRRPVFLMPLRLAVAAVLVPLALGLNLVSSWRMDRPVRGRIISSVFMRFRTGPATSGGAAD
jgi:hypothetical protein